MSWLNLDLYLGDSHLFDLDRNDYKIIIPTNTQKRSIFTLYDIQVDRFSQVNTPKMTSQTTWQQIAVPSHKV